MSAFDPRSIPVLLADPSFVALKSLVVERTGHHYYADKDDRLGDRIARRMAATGIGTAAGYLRRLREAGLGDREWRLLESELTIKETFFFRFAEQFAALRTTILPRLIESRGSRRRLRIWSAGCSTGAEPYSLAIVLSDVLGPALSEWQISILGTDIDERALATAREAVYGHWSLRTMAPAERERLFVPQDGRWRLRLAYSGMVRFERLNILDLDGAAVPLQLSDYDLILCRNMLIYFHPDQATRLVEAIGDRLAHDGWLLLGHAEAGLAMGTSLAGLEAGGVVAYRRSGAVSELAAPPAAPVPTSPVPAAAPPTVPGLSRRRAAPIAVRPEPPIAPPASVAAADDLGEIRRLLDAGETAAASVAIARLRGDGRESARLFFLDAICALAGDDRGAAERSLRSALYLDGSFAMAHYLLAQSLTNASRPSAARRALAAAAAALAPAAPDDAVAEGDGRTVADLRAAIRTRLMTIDAA